jgi:hypothetical protein
MYCTVSGEGPGNLYCTITDKPTPDTNNFHFSSPALEISLSLNYNSMADPDS